MFNDRVVTLLFSLLAAFAVSMVFLILCLSHRSNEYQDRCEAKGGVMVSGYAHKYCIDKTATINMN